VIDLIHIRLTQAELAFLSACTTARTGTQLLDEPIHLAAACQLAGYRHVVASLWPISDDKTAELTKCFYSTVKHEIAQQTIDPAAALHHATRELRANNRLQPHLWAPYTHTGP
jgi:CHAT domain-containing protein